MHNFNVVTPSAGKKIQNFFHCYVYFHAIYIMTHFIKFWIKSVFLLREMSDIVHISTKWVNFKKKYVSAITAIILHPISAFLKSLSSQNFCCLLSLKFFLKGRMQLLWTQMKPRHKPFLFPWLVPSHFISSTSTLILATPPLSPPVSTLQFFSSAWEL